MKQQHSGNSGTVIQEMQINLMLQTRLLKPTLALAIFFKTTEPAEGCGFIAAKLGAEATASPLMPCGLCWPMKAGLHVLVVARTSDGEECSRPPPPVQVNLDDETLFLRPDGYDRPGDLLVLKSERGHVRSQAAHS